MNTPTRSHLGPVILAICTVLSSATIANAKGEAVPPTFTFTWSNHNGADRHDDASTTTAITGRLRLYFARNNDTAPFSSVSDDQTTAQVFGFQSPIAWDGQAVAMPADTFGYPRASLARQDSAEDLMAWIFIPAYCFAFP